MRFDTQHHPIHATTAKAEMRRGSTIIVAVGVLAVLALVAVSYAVVVRTDRAGSAAYERGVDLETSGRVVRDEVGAILAADLFGNKIVTPDVPFEAREGSVRIRIWPRMFEDGEFYDVPQTAPGSFDTRNPERQRGDPVNDNDPWVIALNRQSPTIGSYFQSAPTRDDAWLANTEPFNPDAPLPRDGDIHLQWTTWGQLSNLRSAYRHVTRGPNDQIGVWVRGDGRFADLGAFFLTDFAALTTRGDPGANLTYPDETATNSFDEFTNLLNGPLVGLSSTPVPGLPGVNFATGVFGVQFHQLDEIHSGGSINLPTLSNADERFFTDTDGDLRPDARWQVVDALDGMLGLRWVVASRIVDNSALVNVNTAMEFQDPMDAQRVGDARTPADVDLTRLMRTAYLAPDLRTNTPWFVGDIGFPLEFHMPGDPLSNYFPTRITPFNMPPVNPINQHLVEQLSLDRFMQMLDDNVTRTPLELLWSADPGIPVTDLVAAQDVFDRGNPDQHTTRLQRYLVNRFFGVSPLQPTTERISAYTVADEAELRTFFGLNNTATISKIEQRFDHNRLDDLSGPRSGPMRAKEDINLARHLASDTSIPGDVLPTTLAIASDTRRHLTTVSGVADFSPVPVLNDRVAPDRPFNTKISFAAIPRTSPDLNDLAAAPQRFERDRKNRHNGVRDAFDAFSWALAPLAGHIPLMSPLGLQHTGSQLAAPDQLARFYYGGDRTGIRGPAATLQQEMIAAGVNDSDAWPGAAYAILRAASLALNLYDATDDERIDPNLAPLSQAPPTDATRDLPTVARLYNIVHPDPYALSVELTGLPPLVQPERDSVVRLGASFSWGDLRDASGALTTPPAPSQALLPVGHVGESIEGVTLVGLDRQPFLRQVTTAAFYADRAAFLENQSDVATLALADGTIDPTSSDEQVGVIIAWEIGNPWPEPISLSGYQLAIATDGPLSLAVEVPPSVVLPAGESVVCYIVHWQKDASEADAMRMMFANRDLWVDDITGRDLTTFNLDSGDTGILLLDETGSSPTAGVPFQSWGEGSAVGLILIPENVIPGAGTLVIDRLSADPAVSGSGIPGVASGAISVAGALTLPPNREYTGIAVATGSVNRTTNTASGFPAWVIERPVLNVAHNVSADAQKMDWVVPAGPTSPGSPPPPFGSMGATAAASPAMAELGLTDKGDFLLGAGDDLPPFQLFVPNTELRYTSEALQLCAFTHMYVHDANDTNDDLGALLGAKIAQPDQYGPGAWRTISEQLGSDAELFRDAPGNTLVNPYLGVLDPTRFVLVSSNNNTAGAAALGVLGPVALGSDPFGNPTGLPEALAVPLALRVVDVVEPLWTPDWRGGSRLIQGRVNLNTAAQKTLRMLPLVDPQDPIGSLQPQSTVLANDWRVPMIMAYRDRPTNGSAAATIGTNPAEITHLFGVAENPLRFVDDQVEGGLFTSTTGALPLTRGFVTPGELAILGRWDSANPGNPTGLTGPTGSFLELGANMALDTDTTVPALDVRRGSNIGMADTNIRATPMSGGAFSDGALSFEGIDDVEERLAIYRAVSNIVTARSDVYTAYFKVRGYAPRDIEAVTNVVNDPGPEEIADYLDQLRPRYEARFLAVYDRSTVRTPVDRPKVLLFVRLPD